MSNGLQVDAVDYYSLKCLNWFLLFSDQPWNCGILPDPVQLLHVGESAAGSQRPEPAACGPAGPAERPVLSGEAEQHVQMFGVKNIWVCVWLETCDPEDECRSNGCSCQTQRLN